MKAKVAVLRVSPESILTDIDRLVGRAGVSEALDRRRTTILKDNISWHFPFPGANTTPWQLEGTIQALARRGFAGPGCGPPRRRLSGLRPEQDGRHQRLQGRGSEPLRSDLQALQHSRPLQLQGRGHV